MSRTNITWKNVPRDNKILEHIARRAEFSGESETSIIKDLLHKAVLSEEIAKPIVATAAKKKQFEDDGDKMLADL